jgi:hypothetical protein
MPPATIPKLKSFTVQYNGRTNKLQVETLVSKHLPPDVANFDLEAQRAKKYVAIWDTGATNSVISQRVVDECGLKATGMTMVHSATEAKLCETFFVSIFLPNKVVFPFVRVTKGVLADCDILISMDIISTGDFAVTQKDDKTTFSFRFPSAERIDFVKSKPEPVHSTKISRNSPCPCGSGKKYKKCCGMGKI